MKKNLPFFFLLLSLLFSLNLKAQRNTREIELADIYREYKFYPSIITNLQSMDDGEHFTILSGGRRIDKYNYDTGGYAGTILDIEEMKGTAITSIEAYVAGPGENRILLMTDRENIYRHSFVASYYIYDLKKGSIESLSENGKQQLASFSPDGSKIAFVRNNDIYWKDLKTGKETQITDDGEKNSIINGAPDWVYEEEFGFSKAYEWSPDSKKIAFYKFDESNVRMYRITEYGKLYPDWYSYKYPMAGEKNSVVKIFVADIENKTMEELDTGLQTDQYIPRIKWTKDPDILSIIRLNRLQNHLWILHADARTGESQVVYEEKEEKYISEISDETITYLGSRREFLIISEREDWKSIYVFNFQTGEIQKITASGYDVHSLLGYDEESKTIYYSSHERDPKYLDTWSISLDGRKKKLLTDNKGWNISGFSKNYNYFINEYSNINTPPVFSLHRKTGGLIRVLADNEELKGRMEEYGFSRAEFFSFTGEGNNLLEGYMIKPKDFNPGTSYPVLMFVYGGPQSQEVRDEFLTSRGPWFQYLAQNGYIVACVDNRGTDARGEEFRKSTYLQLGNLETIDQISAAEYLGSLPYINAGRIGIFGWSYGGFMSLSALFKGAEIFKMAIAVAPVTNWRFYDTIYTERFMRTPQENPGGYDRNSPIFFANQMKGSLLLIHGMGDDNVHFQNSVELSRKLLDADKQFDMQFYPDKDHSISGGNTSYHLYTKMSEFLFENL